MAKQFDSKPRELDVLESLGQVDSIYTDFSKVFDEVQFELSLAKLWLSSIPDSVTVALVSKLSKKKIKSSKQIFNQH